MWVLEILLSTIKNKIILSFLEINGYTISNGRITIYLYNRKQGADSDLSDLF